MIFFRKKKIDDLIEFQRKRNEEKKTTRLYDEEDEKLSFKDYLAIFISAALVFGPIFIVLFLLLFLLSGSF